LPQHEFSHSFFYQVSVLLNAHQNPELFSYLFLLG
jgi:hypothetical protein